MTNQTESSIATVGLDMAADVTTLPMEKIREGLCERCGGNPEFCNTQCARPCAFGLRFIALMKEQTPNVKELPDWQKQMQQEAIQRAQTCQKYINGGHDEATAALLAGYKSTAGWNTAKKKYGEHLADLSPMKKKQEALTMHKHVRITQVSGAFSHFTLNEKDMVTIEAPNIQTDGAVTLTELRIFMNELQEALEIFAASVEETSHED